MHLIIESCHFSVRRGVIFQRLIWKASFYLGGEKPPPPLTAKCKLPPPSRTTYTTHMMDEILVLWYGRLIIYARGRGTKNSMEDILKI